MRFLKKLSSISNIGKNEPSGSPYSQNGADGTDFQLTKIIVTQTAIDSARRGQHQPLVGQIIDFTNAVLHSGIYEKAELPPKLLQAYHADYYLEQVNNGGHSQFIHNSSSAQAAIFSDVRVALATIQAAEYASIFEAMLEWIIANPDDAAPKDFPNQPKSETLNALDRDYFKLGDGSAPLKVTLSNWISNWAELSVVNERHYQSAIEKTVKLHPKYQDRQIKKRISRIGHSLYDPMHAHIGMAATNKHIIECIIAIGGGHPKVVDGKQCVMWPIQTTMGNRWACYDDEAASIFEYVVAPDNPTMPAWNDVEGLEKAGITELLEKYKPPEVGECLSSVSGTDFREAVSFAKSVEAAVAVDFLLRQINSTDDVPPVAIVGLNNENKRNPFVALMVVTNGQAFWVFCGSDGCYLAKPNSEKRLASATSKQVQDHLARCGL